MPHVAPYTVSLYRRDEESVSAYREKGTAWRAVAVDVSCDLQPAGGDIEETPAGRQSEATYHGFFDTGLDLQQGDGVEVTAGPGLRGRRFIAVEAHDWGAPGDLEADLEQTREEFL